MTAHGIFAKTAIKNAKSISPQKSIDNLIAPALRHES
jgi:hypothetical protein